MAQKEIVAPLSLSAPLNDAVMKSILPESALANTGPLVALSRKYNER